MFIDSDEDLEKDRPSIAITPVPVANSLSAVNVDFSVVTGVLGVIVISVIGVAILVS